jgi:hypothetical protein
MTLDVIYNGTKLMIEGNFSKGEPQTHNDEGCADSFEITAIYFDGVEITGLLESFNIDASTLEQSTIDACRDMD